MFMSATQMTLQRQNFESVMSGKFYYYVDETQYPIDTVRELFLDEFPGEEKFFEQMLVEME